MTDGPEPAPAQCGLRSCAVPLEASSSQVGYGPSHHIAEPRRQARLLAAITKINDQFFKTWGFANNFLKIGIFGRGKQLLPGRLIGSELLHLLPCRTLDNLNFAIVMGDTHMAEGVILTWSAHFFNIL